MKIRCVLLILSFLLIAVSLPACAPNETQQRILNAAANAKSDAEQEDPAKQAITELLKQYRNTEENEAETRLLAQMVSLSDESLVIINTAIDRPVSYPYSNLSNVKAAYERYQHLPAREGTVINSLVANLPLDTQQLFDLVKANNAVSIEKNVTLKYFQLEDEEILWACEVICDTINHELPALGNSAMLFDIGSNLADLKISKSPGGGLDNGNLTDDNSMYLNPIMLKNMVSLYGEHADEATVAHETEHLIQKLSTETRTALSIERGYGFCVAWEDQPVNSMYFNWLIESSAERLAAYSMGCDPITYGSMRGYLDTCTFLNTLQGSEIKDVPCLTQQPSLEQVFDLFSCVTADEQLELLEMLYAIEVVQVEPEDFMALYKMQLGRELSEEDLIQLKIEMKNAACQTITKYFYRNLSRLLAEQDMPLREVLYLITLFESDLNLHISYADTGRADTIRPFMETYLSTQKAFFNCLSAEMDISEGELDAFFTAFHCREGTPQITIYRNKEEWSSLEISALSLDVNSFILDFSESVLIKKTAPISFVMNLVF